jgi:ADP-heptose:LPS heptosyltransferase
MSHPLPRAGKSFRIAVFRALYLGDLLLAVPALRALRGQFPRAEITLIGLPWAATFADRFRRYIDRFVEFVGYPGISELPVCEERITPFLAEQQAYGYDLALQMHGSGQTSNAFVLALGARATAGYSVAPSASASRALTWSVPYPVDQPEVMRNLGLAALLGCKHLDPTLEFPLSTADQAEAMTLLPDLPQKRRPLIGFHPGASRPARRWPAAYFAALADELARDLGATIVFTGGPDEKSVVQDTVDKMTTGALNLAGKTSLGGLAAIMSGLDLFISNDTGPAHLADALDIASIIIFGPSEPGRWAALDRAKHPILQQPVNCSPCAYRDCPIDHRCLRWIRPQIVSETARELLKRNIDDATSQHSHLAHSR